MGLKFTTRANRIGLFLNGLGLGIVFAGTEFITSLKDVDRFILGLVIIIVGSFLRDRKTKEQEETVYQNAALRYSHIVQRIGERRTLSLHKACIGFALVSFLIALGIMFSGTMIGVWWLIGLIAISFAGAVYTEKPKRKT